MAHITLPSDSARARPRFPLSAMGVGIAAVGTFSALVWVGIIALVL